MNNWTAMGRKIILHKNLISVSQKSRRLVVLQIFTNVLDKNIKINGICTSFDQTPQPSPWIASAPPDVVVLADSEYPGRLVELVVRIWRARWRAPEINEARKERNTAIILGGSIPANRVSSASQVNFDYMTNRAPPEDIIEELQARIQQLELNKAVLQDEVRNIRHQLWGQQQNCRHAPRVVKAGVVRNIVAEPVREPVRDREGAALEIGDQVYLITQGVHRERQGMITDIQLPWVHIEDRTGTYQQRAPHNVRKFI